MKDYIELKKEEFTFDNVGSMNEAKEAIILEALIPKMLLEIHDDEETVENFVNETVEMLVEGGMPIEKIDEGFLGKLLGGVAGFFIGPKIGKVVARALGIEKGVLYDMFTSKLVGIALGTAISKSLKK